MRTTALGVLTLFVVLSGCAATTENYGYPAEKVGTTPATIVIHREDANYGALIAAPVFVNDLMIGKLGPGKVLTATVPSGPIRIRSTAAPVAFEASPGATYRLEVVLRSDVVRNNILGMNDPNFEVTLIGR